MLGARLKWNSSGNNQNYAPFIINPVNNEKVYVMLDPSHMIKLARNRLASCEKFLDGDGNKIEWRFIVSLYKYSIENDFYTHKLTKKHIEWERHSMNVRIAVQTFSESVASSIEVLMNQKVKEFEGAQPTINFIRRMNRLFDCFNSRHSQDKNIFKQRLSPENKRIVFKFFIETIKYFNELKIERIFYKKDKNDKSDEAESGQHGEQNSYINLSQIFCKSISSYN